MSLSYQNIYGQMQWIVSNRFMRCVVTKCEAEAIFNQMKQRANQ